MFFALLLITAHDIENDTIIEHYICVHAGWENASSRVGGMACMADSESKDIDGVKI